MSVSFEVAPNPSNASRHRVIFASPRNSIEADSPSLETVSAEKQKDYSGTPVLPLDPMSSTPFASTFDDPRVAPRFCRRVDHADGSVVLVGVVHDHPASVARVEAVLDLVDTSVLALELPRPAIPLYRSYAREDAAVGGEMSVAIQAAPDAEVVGIDGPNLTVLRRLVTALVSERAPTATVRRVLSSFGMATKTAAECTVAAAITNTTSMTVVPSEPIEYGCDRSDPPMVQAEHERTHVATVRALLSGSRSRTISYRDETREACMIDRLEKLRSRTTGPVVAVIGVDHLDALEAGLNGESQR